MDYSIEMPKILTLILMKAALITPLQILLTVHLATHQIREEMDPLII